MPTLIAAMVIVIKSNGMEKMPISPNTTAAEKIFGTRVIKASLMFLNNTMNINMITKNTVPRVNICELNSEFSILLYITKRPVT